MIGLEASGKTQSSSSPTLLGFEVVRWECRVAYSAGSGVGLELINSPRKCRFFGTEGFGPGFPFLGVTYF